MELKQIILDLESLNGIKFGSFELKNGITSPIYFDLRVIISKPKLLREIARILWKRVVETIEKPDLLCGVPYTALPLATLISNETDIPMLIRRKEVKNYGTKKIIEGSFENGNHCLIIEDVITSGGSVLETAEILQKEGLKVQDAVIFLDREQGGKTNLENNGIKVHSVVTATELLNILHEAGKIDAKQKFEVEEFLKSTQI